ncbi:MAG TPA: TetR/AcrR family transcriptional regulator [Vicinamibacteria bacterium]|nr:TetR/AcrR family transcriptional regulator [Vicinamibacteria bacterium]
MSDAALPPDRPDDHRHRRRAILETAARLICEKGYEGTSIQDIAAACQLTKAGLYHHIRSKEHLLLEIMNYGMDLFEDQVVTPVLPILDPLERLTTCMERNILMVAETRSKEVTIILHEHNTLTGEARAHIDARKKRYVRLLEASFAEAVREGTMRPVNPKVAAFAFLGMVLWTYKWYRPEGALSKETLAREMVSLFFGGLTTAPPPRRSPRARAAAPRQPRRKPKRR